ncbi:hypothetical protein [uncultured Pseudodesulfovibrio sp.]|uniref:hypothetical protein n=1 Tax=uncultured Pseudodesulfovibrio sp. TaxID=2035858 RepID=UPI0029C8B126|nr:hypothetical protein [uncultured Pseudodesulfovibrio sp.]
MTTFDMGGKTVSLQHIQGMVSYPNKTVKTHMSGGGGTTIRGTGHIRDIKTTHVEETDFWVTTREGKDVVLMGKNLSTGDNHYVKIQNPLFGGIFITVALPFLSLILLSLFDSLTISGIAFLASIAFGIKYTYCKTKSFKQLNTEKDKYMRQLA